MTQVSRSGGKDLGGTDNFDDKLSRALAADEEVAGFAVGESQTSADQNIFQELSDVFHGRQRWLNVLGAVLQLIYLGLCVWSAYRFFGAEAVREQILFATGFLASLGITMAFKIWFWMVLNRNSVLREVKRLEIQVARLAQADSATSRVA